MSHQISINESIVGDFAEAYRWPVGPIDLLNPQDSTPQLAEIDRDELVTGLLPLIGQDWGILNDFPMDQDGIDTFEDFLLTGVFDAILAYKQGLLFDLTPSAEAALQGLMQTIEVDGVPLAAMSVAELEALRDEPEGAPDDPQAKGFFKKVWRAIKQAAKKIFQTIAGFVVEVGKFFIDVDKVEVEEAVATLMRPPQIDFEPVGVRYNLNDLSVDIKVRVYLKIMGRRLELVAISKSGVIFRARGFFEFDVNSNQLRTRPVVENADAVIQESFYGLRVTITIGITGILNKALQKLGWIDLFELSQFRFPVPGSPMAIEASMRKVRFAQDEMQILFSTRLRE